MEHNQNGSTGLADLPTHILSLMLARLPLPVLLRLRLLSSSWNALLRSHAFLKEIYEAREAVQGLGDSWIVVIRPGFTNRRDYWFFLPKELIAFCPRLCTWCPLPIDTLHPHIVARYLGPGFLRVPLHALAKSFPVLSSIAMASSAGLICCVLSDTLHPPPTFMPSFNLIEYFDAFRGKPHDNINLLVFNPVTGVARLLPPPPVPPPPSSLGRPSLNNSLAVFMFPDASAPGCYFVLLVHDPGYYIMTFKTFSVYSSKTKQWKAAQPRSPFYAPSPYSTFEDVVGADLFSYCYLQFYDDMKRVLGSSYPYPSPPADVLSAYNIVADAWNSVYISPLAERSFPTHIFKYQMHIFLAIPYSTPGDYYLESGVHGFQVFQLIRSQGKSWHNWRKVAQTPSSHFWNNFPSPQPYPRLVHICFTCCDNLLCMSGYYPTGSCFEGECWPPIVYDMTTGSWYNLPRPTCGTSHSFGLAFLTLQPHLLATP